MNFVQMRAFHAVARHGSVSAAAQELGVSRPAVTIQIRALEETLGARLFNRKGHAMEVSEIGRRFLDPVRTMARILSELEGMSIDTAKNKGGLLRVGACAPFVAVPLVAAFRRSHPGVRIETEMSNSETLYRRVQDHEIDVAVATLMDPPGEFESFRLVTQSVRAIVPVGHPWAELVSISIEDLATVTIVDREFGSMTRRILQDAAAKLGVELSGGLEFGSREAVKEAVAAGLGVGYVFDHEVGRDDGIAALKISGADVSAGEFLYCQKDLAEIGSIKAFIDVAEQMFPRTVEQARC